MNETDYKIIEEMKEKSKSIIYKRSYWRKGLYQYTIEMIEMIEEISEYNGSLPVDSQALEKMLLNGAQDWKQSSWDGCWLIYDRDIAERLCTPSELKKNAKWK